MNKKDKIYIAGHSGMVGSAILRKLTSEGYGNILTISHNDLDLTQQTKTFDFIKDNKPDYIVIAAAHVGGIKENKEHPAQLLYENMMINANIMQAAHEVGVKKLMVLGSSCIYPRECKQPITEDEFLAGKPEPTNQGYSIGKIAALEMAKYYNLQYHDCFINCMPTNIYGVNDNFDLNASHVIPAMIRKYHEAKIQNKTSVTSWGTGKPLREFMYVDDLADAILFLMQNYEDSETINIGTGEEVSIKQLNEEICNIVGYSGKLEWDTTKPDGNPRKLLDCSKIQKLGWHSKTSLKDGLEKTYKYFIDIRGENK